MKKYTIEELKRNKNVVIYIDSKEKHDKIEKQLNLCIYYGAYCYSSYDGTYSSDSSKNNIGSYVNKKLIDFSQIDFQENLIQHLEIW